MDRNQALKKLQKRFGKTFAWKENQGWKPLDIRQAASARAKELHATEETARHALEARRKELLDADEQYQALSKAWREVKGERVALFSVATTRRFDVGTASELFFHVSVSGDSWEDIFRQLDERDRKK